MPTPAAAPPDGTATTLDRPSDAPGTGTARSRAGVSERVRGAVGAAVRGDRGVAVALGAASLAVYVRSLLPGVGYSGDTAKWQFLGEAGGTPHPTGYPLYLLLNRAWVHAVPVGQLAWRVNLLSAVLGAATVATLFLLLRALDVRRTVAAATAATYAVTVTFWSQAVVAEVYTLHLFFLAIVTLCLTRWLGGGSDEGPDEGSDRWLLAGLGLYALSFGNHLGSALALPGVAWLVWRGRRAIRPRHVAWVALFAAVGAGQYAYLVRMTDVGAYVEQPVHGVGDIVGLVTGGHFRQHMFAFGPGELVRDRLPMFGRLLRSELGVLLVPAAYGLVRAVRGRHRAVAVHLLLLGVLAATYALNFDVLDVFVFFLPCYLVLAVFLGIGLDGAVDRLEAVEDRRLSWGITAALIAMPLVAGAVNYPRASLRGEVGDAHRIERAIDAAGSDAVLITDNYADSEYVWYYLLGERLGAERHLKLANQVRPREVEAFFDRHRGPLARVARPGTPVYTATAHQAWALAYEGLTVTLVAENVWRVGVRHDLQDRP